MLYFDLCVLFAAHLIGDYPLQGNFLATYKGKNNFLMFVHCYLWSVSVVIGFFIIGLEVDIITFLILIITHYIIDKWKANDENKDKALTTLLYIDQSLHCLVILLIYILLRGM